MLDDALTRNSDARVSKHGHRGSPDKSLYCMDLNDYASGHGHFERVDVRSAYL